MCRLRFGLLSNQLENVVEEPVPADSPAADWAELAMLPDVPLAGGENVASFASFASLISARSHKLSLRHSGWCFPAANWNGLRR